VADRAARYYDRGHDPVGMLRQAVAVIASGDRTDRLCELRVPTLVRPLEPRHAADHRQKVANSFWLKPVPPR
jgi:hypothetical protein